MSHYECVLNAETCWVRLEFIFPEQSPQALAEHMLFDDQVILLFQLSPIYFLQYIAIYQQKKTNPLKYNPLLLRQCITLNEEVQI